MKTTTQRNISKKLGLTPSTFCKLISGTYRPSAKVAAALEVATGIGLRSWLFGKPSEIKRELERVYGKINFKRGRLPHKKEVGK